MIAKRGHDGAEEEEEDNRFSFRRGDEVILRQPSERHSIHSPVTDDGGGFECGRIEYRSVARLNGSIDGWLVGWMDGWMDAGTGNVMRRYHAEA